MNSCRVVVEKLSSLDEARGYDLFFATLGFEERATHNCKLLSRLASKRVACGFGDRHVLHYGANKAWFQENGFEVFDFVQDGDFAAVARKGLDFVSKDPACAHVCIDISSLNRYRLAVLLDCLRFYGGQRVIRADFVYSLGAFSPPPLAIAPNTHFGPVSPGFAGWTVDPNKPPVAIVGLGYEEGKAIGAVEYLQSDETWVFIPKSPEEEYFTHVMSANELLLQGIPDSQKIIYRVDDPMDCFAKLESLVYGLSRTGRAVLLPFGPKIFSLISMLVAWRYPEVSVWRVSAQHSEAAVDRHASGHVIGLSAIFEPDVLR
jgi:hypothetical protein